MSEPLTKAPKKKNSKYFELAKEALTNSEVTRSGLSRVLILKYIIANNEVSEKIASKYLNLALNAAVESGDFIQVTGTGANGSFKLGDALKKAHSAAKSKAIRAAKSEEKKASKPAEQTTKTTKEPVAKKSTETKEKKDKPVAKKSSAKIGARKSIVSAKKITVKKMQVASKLIKENKMEKPKKGDKLHVSILIKKPKSSTKKTKKGNQLKQF